VRVFVDRRYVTGSGRWQTYFLVDGFALLWLNLLREGGQCVIFGQRFAWYRYW
jgi:hypothetical protein